MGARYCGGRRKRIAETTSTLAIAAALAAAGAHAADVTISNGVTSPVTTSNANNGPGNVTIQNNGSVTVSAPAAVTIDSSNTVSNAGSITNNQATGAVGIRGLLTAPDGTTPLNLTSTITNTGGISAPGAGTANQDTFNAGIRLDGLGTFTGNITNDTNGNIGVSGQSAYGIQVGSSMVGNISNVGTIGSSGISGYGIMTTGNITGNITSTGTVNATGAGGVGIYVGGNLNGTIGLGNSTTASNILVGAGPSSSTSGTPVFQTSGKAALWIGSNVTQGVTISGNGATQADEAANRNISTTNESTLTSTGGGSTVIVQPGGPGGFENFTIGATTDSPYSVVNRGNIVANSTLPRNSDPSKVNPYTNPFGIVTNSADSIFVNVPGVDSTAVLVSGATNNGTNYTATLSGGFGNEGGNVNATATNATATGFRIGSGGNVSTINNAGDFVISSVDTTIDPAIVDAGDLGGDAYGIRVDQGGTLNSVVNSGRITVSAQGQGHSAYGVLDQSGTITSFTNSGTIRPTINTYNTQGRAVAVDLSANTTGVTFTNSGLIAGPVFLGSGINNVTYTGGTQTGNLTFTGGTNTLSFSNSSLTGAILLGSGASSVSIAGNSAITGGVVSTGTANLNVSQSSLNIADTSRVQVTNMTVSSGSAVTFNLNGQGTNTGVIQATGNVSIASGATLTPIFTGVIQNPETINLITAGNLSLGAAVSSYIPVSTSYMNTYTAGLSATNPNILQLAVRRRTAAEMGLGRNMSVVYEGSIPALALDPQVAAALGVQSTKAQFVSAFNQLMPDASDATRQTALSNQNMALGAVRRRLEGIADPRNPEHDVGSLWIQGLGTIADASGSADDTRPGYSYWGLGFALGADVPITDDGKAGMALSGTFTSVDLGLTQGDDSFLLVYSAQLNAYARQNFGRFYVQAMGGAGINTYDQRRDIRIGGFTRIATGKSTGHQFGGTFEGGVRLEGGKIEITPYLRFGYLTLHQNGYSEKNGGLGINQTQSARNNDSLRGTVGLNLERDFALYYDSMLETDLRVSYTREFKNDPTIFTSRFSSAGTPFQIISRQHGPSVYAVGFGIGHRDSFSSVTFDYDAEFIGGLTSHIATVTLRFRF